MEEAIRQLEQDLLPVCPEVGLLIDSLKSSSRGITR